MTLCSEIEAEIIRLSLNEYWPIGSIARELKIHRSVVQRVLSQKSDPEPKKRKEKKKIVEEYLEFIKYNLNKYPDVHSSRLFNMVKQRGYSGISASYFRKIIAQIRPEKTHEAFARLSTLPGEQAQVDWAEFGKVTVGKSTQKLMAFVMTLSWSRGIYVRFFFVLECLFFNKVLWIPLIFLAEFQEPYFMTI